jgi:hypothetical protein
MIRIITNGKENGKRAYLAQTKWIGKYITFASIVFDGEDWLVRRNGGRIDRFKKLSEARNEVLKGV